MWFYLSLFFAIWSSVFAGFLKKLSKNFSPTSLLFLNAFLTLPFIFGLSFFLYRTPHITLLFLVFMVISALIDVTAFLCSFKAIRISPISLLAPLGTITPVFVTLFAFLFLHETPTLLKLFGILLIVFGAYCLNIKDIRHGLFKPFTKLLSHRGVQLASFANLLWAITPIFQKQAIFQTTPTAPLLVSAMGLLFTTLFISPFALKQVVKNTHLIYKNKWFFLTLAIFGALSQLAAYTAFSTSYLGYVTAVFRLSTLFTILFGYMFFKEKDIGERFLGAGIMLLGTLLLAF